tara:strand:+ start:835 stop:1416 length:582 start_codon:yes stop_codon:yes gene_type:complete
MSAYTTALKMAVPSLFKGVSNMFNKPPQRKVSSDTTALLNKQRQIAKEGLYGQDVKNEIMTDVKQANKETENKIRSTAVKQGLENSGIVADQLIKQGGQTTLQIARLAKEIARANEESKLNALASASQTSQGIEDVRYTNALNRFQRRDDIVSSIADAGTVFSDAFREAEQDEEFNEMFKNPEFLKVLKKVFK